MSTQKNEALEPDIIKRVNRFTHLIPDAVKQISDGERALVTIEGEEKDVTIHLNIPRELWDLVTEILFLQDRLFLYDHAKQYFETKLAEAVKQDIIKISELGLLTLPDFLLEEDC